MKVLSTLTLSIGLTLAGAAILGCSAADPITNAITCNDVCSRYSECFNADYDIDGCTDRCENDATSDEDKERRLEMCDSCIDDRSCAESFVNCSDDCAGIVP